MKRLILALSILTCANASAAVNDFTLLMQSRQVQFIFVPACEGSEHHHSGRYPDNVKIISYSIRDANTIYQQLLIDEARIPRCDRHAFVPICGFPGDKPC